MDRQLLVSPDFIDSLDSVNLDEFSDFPVLSKMLLEVQEQPPEEAKTELPETSIKILFSHNEPFKSKNFQDFVSCFNGRYKSIEKIIANRPEMQNITSISRVRAKKDRETVSIVGLVQSKQLTKNGNINVSVEDPTGIINVLVNKNKPELFSLAKDIVCDEVIGVSGVNGDRIIFSNKIFWPEVPYRELKKAPKPGYALFLSDMHVGSNKFLGKEFDKFLRWLNCSTGSPYQRELASKINYIFIIGDLVDGVGIYPDQDSELEIEDIYRQYDLCAELLAKIPERIKVIICPGNHDAVRISEPQPPLPSEFASKIINLPNVVSVSNPALVNIHSSNGFEGFDVLLYHGYSFDYYVSNVDGIRQQGGYDRADLIMKFLLQRRHLAPSHSSTLYIPCAKDPLVIDKVPDFFATGHIHKSSVSNYRNITLICGSCWQSKTSFQERVGHHPEPCRVPIVNLATREMKILKFG